MQVPKTIFKKVVLWSISVLVIGAILLVGCQKKYSKAFVYESEFIAYLDSTFSVKKSDKEVVYFVMPLASCAYCTQKSYEVLNKLPLNKHLVLILVGDLKNAPVEHTAFMTLPFNKLHDVHQVAYRFGFGLAKPMIIRTRNNHCIFGKEISDDLIGQIPKMLQ